MTYQIDRGVPLPKKRCKTPTYPFEQMEIGDSFLAPKDRQSNVIYSAMKRGFKVSTRSADADHVRVWLVERLPQVRA